MTDEKFIVAIELGSSKAKIGVAGFDPNLPDGKIKVYSSVCEPVLDSIRYGRIHNPREVSATLTRLLDLIQNRYPLEGRNILGAYVSVGGRSLRSHRIKSKIILPERCEISEELIDHLQSEAIKQLQTDDEIICVEPIRYTVDKIHTPRPIGSKGSHITGEFSAVTCNRSNTTDLKDVISDRVGLSIRGMAVRPMALAALVLTPHDLKAGCMLVDFGAETTTVSIYKDYALQYLVTIPLGSRLITRDLATVLAITDDEAEALKLSHSDAMPDASAQSDPELEGMHAIVLARLADIIANINAQPEFAGMSAVALPAGIVLTGGGAKMRNFALLLEKTLHMKVRMAILPSEIIVTDNEMSGADNLDLIALLCEGVESARRNNDMECVSAPPVVKEPETKKESSTADVIFDITASKTKAETKTQTEEKPHQNYKVDDEPDETEPDTYNPFDETDNRWLLDDDDDESTRRRKVKPNHRADEKKIVAKGGKSGQPKRRPDPEPEPEPEPKGPSKIDMILKRITGILTGEGEDKSADMND